jgi:hypothetical protein
MRSRRRTFTLAAVCAVVCVQLLAPTNSATGAVTGSQQSAQQPVPIDNDKWAGYSVAGAPSGPGYATGGFVVPSVVCGALGSQDEVESR